MERLGQEYGYILYRTTLDTEESVEKLRLWEAADRANILLEEEPLLTLYDKELEKEAKIDQASLSERQREAFTETPRKSGGGPRLDILVENMGRVNFGPRMEHQRKGIAQCVQINGHMHCGWEIFTLPLDDIGAVDFQVITPNKYRPFTVLSSRWMSRPTPGWTSPAGAKAAPMSTALTSADSGRSARRRGSIFLLPYSGKERMRSFSLRRRALRAIRSFLRTNRIWGDRRYLLHFDTFLG